MLDIISMAILLFLLIGLPLILIIIGGNNKTEEEQRLEDEEQMKYLEEYKKKKLNKKVFWEVKDEKKIIYLETSNFI